MLDRLLDEERLEITAISGTSAGAMNAVLLAHGLAQGGRHEAKQALLRFWTQVSQASAWSQGLAGLFWDWALPGSPLAWTMEWMTRTWSPYQLNPLDLNPLRDILDRLNEITFNSSLLKELRSIALLQQLLAAEGLPAGVGPGSLFQQVARLRLHRIDATEDMAQLGAASKLNAAWPMIQRLHAIGRDTADAWLKQHGAHIGRKSTLDLTECL
ncbi:MAG: patatin-like phospholipase family protein [Aquabacterium sp.]